MRTVLCFVMLFLLGCQAAKSPRTAPAGGATIETVNGQAEVRRGNRAWESAREGMTLQEGDQARTSGGSGITFRLEPHGGVLSLAPGSTLRFDQLGPKSPRDPVQASINLSSGRVVGDTLKLPAGSKVVIKTPQGTSEIR